MPDLMPDTSVLKPQGQGLGNMSLLDLIGLAKGAQQLSTQRALSDAISQNTDPTTGQTNWSGVSGQFGNDSNATLRTPEQMHSISSAADAALTIATHRAQTAAQLLAPLTALGTKVTRKDVAAVLPGMTQLIGAQEAQRFNQLLDLPDGAPLASAILNLKQGLVGTTEPSVAIPGVGGGPSRTVTPYQGERAAAGLLPSGAQAPGVPSTEEPPELKTERGAAETFQERVTPLVNAIASARKLGPDATGPLSDEFNTIKKAAGVLGIKGIDWDKVNSYDSLKKALTQWSDNLSTGGTNDRLAQAIAGNPNLNMRNATIQTLAKVAYAQEARRQAIYSEFSNSGLPNSAFPAFKAQVNQAWDPRAFTMPMMSPQARSAMLKSMTPTERAKFEQSWSVAKKYISSPPEGGWYTPADTQVTVPMKKQQ